MSDEEEDEYQYESDYAYDSGDQESMDEDEDAGGGSADVHGRSVGGGEVSLLEPAELKPMMNAQIDEVASVIELPRVAVSALLRQYGWNKESLFDQYYSDPAKTTAKAGVDLWTEQEGSDSAASFDAAAVVLPAPTGEVTCEICYCDYEGDESVASPCGHFFCTGCYKAYLVSKVADGPEVVFTTCPMNQCPCLVPPQLYWKVIAEQETLDKYQRFMLHSFVDRNKSMRWCPGRNCNYIFKAPVGTLNVKCEGRSGACGIAFCFKCGEEAHQPSSCHELQTWQEKCQNDSETANWILANTKRCPKCNTRIEKNQGCNHMTCRSCKHDFCWICMGPWKDHGANTGGYYKCNKYDPNKPLDDESNASKAKQELDRYLHFYQRYHNHNNAQKFASGQREATEKRMVDMQEASSDMTWIDVQFLKDAVDMLIECRRVLKFTYVYGFYLPHDTAKRELFEDHQENLEKFTEHLSELSEMPLENMQRTEVINYTRITSRFMQEMLKAVEEGS